MAISVESSAVQAAAGHVDNVNAQLTATMNRLKAECEHAKGNFFDGGAGNQFQLLMNRYQDAQNKISQALGDIANGIRQNGKGYDATEQEVLQNVHSAGASGALDIPTMPATRA